MTDVIDPVLTLQDSLYELNSSFAVQEINVYDSPSATFVRTQTPLEELSGPEPGAADVDAAGNLYVCELTPYPGDQIVFVEQFDSSGTSLGKIIPDLAAYGVMVQSAPAIRVTDTHIWLFAQMDGTEEPIILQFLLDGTFVDSWTGMDAFGSTTPFSIDVDSDGLVYYLLFGANEIGVWDPVAGEQRPSAVVLPAEDESLRGMSLFRLIPGSQGGLIALVEVEATELIAAGATGAVGRGYVLDVYDAHGERTQRIVETDVAPESPAYYRALAYGEESRFVWIAETSGGSSRGLASNAANVKFDLNTGLEVAAVATPSSSSTFGFASYYGVGAGITRPPTIEWLWRLLGTVEVTRRRAYAVLVG